MSDCHKFTNVSFIIFSGFVLVTLGLVMVSEFKRNCDQGSKILTYFLPQFKHNYEHVLKHFVVF